MALFHSICSLGFPTEVIAQVLGTSVDHLQANASAPADAGSKFLLLCFFCFLPTLLCFKEDDKGRSKSLNVFLSES